MRRLADAVIALAGLVCAVALVRDTAYQGQDFAVFWHAARAVMDGQPAYDLARDGGMVFKYPPWILPFFFPFACFPLAAAKWIWGVTEVASLLYALVWTWRHGVSGRVVAIAACLFWGVWAVHALDGQISLPLLAIALWAWDRRARPGAMVTVVWATSAKVFSSLALLGVARAVFRPRILAATIVVLGVLSVPAGLTSAGRSPGALAREWAAAAGSGGTMLEGEKIRARENQGIPAMVLRAAGIPAREAGGDIALCLITAAVLAALWSRVSRGLSPDRRWAGWLAVATIAHPLAWFHSFVWIFPLAAFAAGDAWRTRKIGALVWAGVGVVLTAAVSRRTFGDAGVWLELASVRSWGTVACAVGLVRAGVRS